MRLVFIDETGDQEQKDYLGFCIATVDGRFYPLLKRKAHSILKAAGWDPAVEFKGHYLFSASKGCSTVPVDTRVEAAGRLLDLNSASQNSRMYFHYGRLSSANPAADYMRLVPPLLNRALSRAPTGAGKNLISVVCNERSDISRSALHAAIDTVVKKKGFVLLENVIVAHSTYDTIGLMFADLVAYLAARVDTIASDVELVHGLTPEQIQSNGKLRKLQSSRALIDRIKNLTLYTGT